MPLQSVTSAAAHPMRRCFTVDNGDTYDGHVEAYHGVMLPHGRGSWRSGDGQLQFDGHFVRRWRDGYGRLLTPHFVLWARWRMDRPDLSPSTRVDYCNGDRYCGVVELLTSGAAAAAAAAAPRVSRFSQWARGITPRRQRWGELVRANGDRFFGEWRDDLPHGFGCFIAASGERYTGRFFNGCYQDTGTLFLPPWRVEGCLSCIGVEPPVMAAGGSTPPPPGRRRAALSLAVGERWPPASRHEWGGCIFDGVWSSGRCCGEGHMTLPSGVRISAEWRSASHPVDGEVVLPASAVPSGADAVHEWQESFQWESILCNSSDAAQRAESTKAVEEIRHRVGQATSTQAVQAFILEMLDADAVLRAAIRIFQRCFYFLYGTCGEDATIGAGGCRNRLGWCSLRSPYGGCIHHRRGKHGGGGGAHDITAGDLDLALRDIRSFARSAVRWVLELLSNAGLEGAIQDGSAELLAGRWVIDAIFTQCYAVLLNLYKQVYAAEEAALSAAIRRLHGSTTLDDMGVVFARQSKKEERLFDPYTDAVNCIKTLSTRTQTWSSLLKTVVQWSREIDLSTRLTQASLHDTGPSGSFSSDRAAQLAGSADDLLPIHQYVLSQCFFPHLLATVQLMSDISKCDLFLCPTSQEAFGITTLEVCIMTLARLHPWTRDDAGVLVPPYVAVEHLAGVVQYRRTLVEHVRRCCQSLGCSSLDGDAALLCRVVDGYVRSWLPRTVGYLGERLRYEKGQGTSRIPMAEWGLSSSDMALTQLSAGVPVEAQIACWLYTGAILAALHLTLEITTARHPSTVFSVSAGPYDEVALRAACHQICCITADGTVSPILYLCQTSPLLPSFLTRMEGQLTNLL